MIQITPQEIHLAMATTYTSLEKARANQHANPSIVNRKIILSLTSLLAKLIHEFYSLTPEQKKEFYNV